MPAQTSLISCSLIRSVKTRANGRIFIRVFLIDRLATRFQKRFQKREEIYGISCFIVSNALREKKVRLSPCVRMCVCVCVCARARARVCVREREREVLVASDLRIPHASSEIDTRSWIS